MSALFSSPKIPKSDTSAQEALIKKQEEQMKAEEAADKEEALKRAATKRVRRAGPGILSGSELGVTPVGREKIG